MVTERATCELCGEPMPDGEEMFKFHGYSGPCPKPPLPKPAAPPDNPPTHEPDRPAARCVWRVGVQGYHTDCGRTWFRSDRDIVRDGAVACPYCGQPLVVEAPHE